MQSTYNITNYDTILATGNYETELKVNIAGVYYFENNIVSCTTSIETLSSSDPNPGVGTAVAAQLDLVLIGVDSSSIPKMAEIKLYLRLIGASGLTSGWLSKGTFFIDTRSTDESDQLTIHGYDAMLKADIGMVTASGQQSNWPQTDIQVLDGIATRIGVTVDDRTRNIVTNGYTIDYPGFGEDGYTMRQMLGYVAAMYGGSIFISDDNTLLLRQVKTPEAPIVAAMSVEDYDTKQIYSPSIPYSGIEGNTGQSALTVEMPVSADIADTPNMSVKGTATVTREKITERNITASVNLKFVLNTNNTYTDKRWRLQLVWSNLKDNKSDFYTFAEGVKNGGVRWHGKSTASIEANISAQQWTTPNDRTLHIDVYSDSINDWEDDHQYAKDAIVEHSNEFYKCRKAHTSGNSFDDSKWKRISYSSATTRIARVNVVFPGAKMPKYDNTVDTPNDIIVYTHSDIPYWSTNTSYTYGDKVRRDSVNYNCVHSHTSGLEFWEINPTTEVRYWEKIEESLIMVFDCPWATQAMVNTLYEQLKGFTYQPFEVGNAICNPAIEPMEFIAVVGQDEQHPGVLAYAFNRTIEFAHLLTMNLSAPSGGDLTHEYKFNETATRELLKNIVKKLQTKFTTTEGLIETLITGITTMYHMQADPSSSHDMQVGDIWYEGSSWYRWSGSGWESTGSRAPAKWKKNKKGATDSDYGYMVGDYVTYLGNWYQCKKDHNSGNDFDPTKWNSVTVIEYDASSMIRQEIDQITLGVTFADDRKSSTFTLSYGEATISSETVNIIGNLNLYGNIYRTINGGGEGTDDEQDEKMWMMGINTYKKSGVKHHRLQVGSAGDTSGENGYDSMSVYGGGPIYLMAEGDDDSRYDADVTINENGILINALKGSSGTSADNHILTIDTTTGQIKVCDKTRNNIGSGEAVFG